MEVLVKLFIIVPKNLKQQNAMDIQSIKNAVQLTTRNINNEGQRLISIIYHLLYVICIDLQVYFFANTVKLMFVRVQTKIKLN